MFAVCQVQRDGIDIDQEENGAQYAALGNSTLFRYLENHLWDYVDILEFSNLRRRIS